MLSASLTPNVVTPAIGQQPSATAETFSPELPRGRRLLACMELIHHNDTTSTTQRIRQDNRIGRMNRMHGFIADRVFHDFNPVDPADPAIPSRSFVVSVVSSWLIGLVV